MGWDGMAAHRRDQIERHGTAGSPIAIAWHTMRCAIAIHTLRTFDTLKRDPSRRPCSLHRFAARVLHGSGGRIRDCIGQCRRHNDTRAERSNLLARLPISTSSTSTSLSTTRSISSLPSLPLSPELIHHITQRLPQDSRVSPRRLCRTRLVTYTLACRVLPRVVPPPLSRSSDRSGGGGEGRPRGVGREL